MIKFENIYLSYGGKSVLKNFSLEADLNSKVQISGRSGTGKSSLLSLLLGFVQPDSGRILFDGRAVDEKSVWDVRKKTAYVDQDSVAGYGRVSDWLDTVSGFRANSGIDLSAERFYEKADFFELDRSVYGKLINDLSGGERQRVSIIVSILSGRKVFLLDEATSALDKGLKAKTAEFFLSQSNWTVIVVSHDHVWSEKGNIKVFDIEEGAWKR